MATTPNFGWVTPAPTDLVTDLPADFEIFADAVDATFVDLKGGTTGQVLAKASGTDMDFTWATDASGISATIFDAKGDIIAASAADTAARLAVGANGTVLTADSGETTGLKWASAGAGSDWALITSGSLSGSGASITFSSLGSYEKLALWFSYASSTNANFILKVIPNGDATKYVFGAPSVARNGVVNQFGDTVGTDETLGAFLGKRASAGAAVSGSFFIEGCKGSNPKFVIANGHPDSIGSNDDQAWLNTFGILDTSVAITSLELALSTGTFDNGIYKLWGSTK